jgi:hypothetical protein
MALGTIRRFRRGNSEYAVLIKRRAGVRHETYLGRTDSDAVRETIEAVAASKSVPAEIHRLFWDVNPARLDLRIHARFVIERVAEFGNASDFDALSRVYAGTEIVFHLKRSRSLSERSRRFALLWYGGRP